VADRISEAGPYAPVVVEVCDGDVVVGKGKMNRVMGLVGKSPECLFHINSPGLSKFHCSLVRTPTGLWVVDLLSRRGTCLNGRRVRSGRVHEGDLVQVGKYTLRFKRAAWTAKGSGQVGEAAGAGPTNALVPARQGRPAPPAKDETTALEPARAAASAAVAPRARPTMVAAPDQTLGPEWSMLVALVTQFNRMQQQMFDQFQESMLMTTRMFTSLQQDQMALVREELEQLRGITNELHSLQKTLDVPPAVSSLPLAGQAIEKAQLARNGATAGAPAAGVPGDPKGKTAPAVPTPKPAPAKTAAGATPLGSSADVHSWLNQRISALQEERQTRWHKLLGLILGK
jgi:hypothetical protein